MKLANPYTAVHAAIASAILLGAMFCRGFSGYWHRAVYGDPTLMKPAIILACLFLSMLMFGALALFCWISTLFQRRDSAEPAPPPDRLKAVRLAAVTAPATVAIAIGAACLGGWIFKLLLGVEPMDQELIRFLTSPDYPLATRVGLCALMVVQAPFTEEPLFRGVIFRGYLKKLPPWAAMALSGFVFAVCHCNAAAFLGLWYVGVAFAWLYWKTGSILAPITSHLLFNLANLALAFVIR